MRPRRIHEMRDLWWPDLVVALTGSWALLRCCRNDVPPTGNADARSVELAGHNASCAQVAASPRSHRCATVTPVSQRRNRTGCHQRHSGQSVRVATLAICGESRDVNKAARSLRNRVHPVTSASVTRMLTCPTTVSTSPALSPVSGSYWVAAATAASMRARVGSVCASSSWGVATTTPGLVAGQRRCGARRVTCSRCAPGRGPGLWDQRRGTANATARSGQQTWFGAGRCNYRRCAWLPSWPRTAQRLQARGSH